MKTVQIQNYRELHALNAAVESIYYAYQFADAYEKDARVYCGELHDLRGEEAVKTAFYSYLTEIAFMALPHDAVEFFARVAFQIADALRNFCQIDEDGGWYLELYWGGGRDGIIANPDEDKTAELERKHNCHPRLYVGGGQILSDVAR